jgi:hypothetical protein
MDDMLDPWNSQMMAGGHANRPGTNHRDGKSFRHLEVPPIHQWAGCVSGFAKIASNTAGSGGASSGSLSVISLNMASRPPTLST